MTGQSRIQTDRMLMSMRPGKDIYQDFSERAEEVINIQGKSLQEWRKVFHIKIPENPDIYECKQIGRQLMELYQEAAFLKAMAEAANILLRRGYESEYHKKFESLVAQYRAEDKKLPASATLETLAKQSIDDVESALAHSDLAVRFWKEILEQLNYNRKVTETITINNSVEAKIGMPGA